MTLTSPGTDVTFITYLAGVREDKTGEVLIDIPGTMFRWRYKGGDESVTDLSLSSLSEDPPPGTVEFLGYIDPAEIDETWAARLRSHGVLSPALPEPSAATLLAGGVMLCLAGGRPRRSSAKRRLGL